MNKRNLLIIGAVIILGGLGVFAYMLRPSAEASAPIEAIPLAVNTPAISDPLPTDDNDRSNQSAENSSDTPVIESVEGDGDAAVASMENLSVFTIEQSESLVSFSIDEILRGKPVTAVGVTNQVAGEVGIDFENSANIVLGTIQVNARNLSTDQEFRNRAIANEILNTGEYEFITFVPVELVGLPLAIEFSVPYTIQVIGDLTIRDITETATWEMTITVISESEIRGVGSTTVLREDYNLIIPEVNSVAEVSQEVLLEINFMAMK
jgi:polyisoprenoid-binding protein YceI